MVDRLSQKLSKLLVVENLEATSTGDFADGGGVEAMVVITVAALDKNAGVAEALSVHLASHVVQVHPWRKETTDRQYIQNLSHAKVKMLRAAAIPLPMCRRVFSIVELRLTLDSSPRQKRFLLLEGSVKPSTSTLVEEAW